MADGRIIFEWHDEALADYLHWQKHNKNVAERIDRLLADIRLHPFEGIGKPKPLRGNLRSYWSRRIDEENRLVYVVKENNIIEIRSCRSHYKFSP